MRATSRKEPSHRPMFQIELGDAFDWMRQRPPDSVHAIVTDPHLWLPIVVLLIGIGVLVLVK